MRALGAYSGSSVCLGLVGGGVSLLPEAPPPEAPPSDVTISLLHGAQLTNGLGLTAIMGPSNRLCVILG